MPVDEPMLDLGGTSADGLDLDDPGRLPGTVYPGAAVDARELEFGAEPGPQPREDRIPSGVFETTEVDLAVDRVVADPLPSGVFETTPWEPAPAGAMPRLSTMETTPWEPAPTAPEMVATGARELELAGPGPTAPEPLPRGPRELDFGDPDPPQSAVPRAAPPDLSGAPDLELAMDPVRPADSSGTVFDGSVPDLAGPTLPAGQHRLDLTPTGPVDASLISGEYASSGISSEFPAPAEGRARHTAVVELFRLIDKAVKMLNLYEGSGESCERQIAAAYSHLVEVLRAFGNLLLTVTPYEFLMEGEPVYTTDEERRGITYRLFRDGVRELEILPHLGQEEFNDLLAILRATRAQGGEEDTVTQLWERNFAGLHYRAVDFFLEGMIIGESEQFQHMIEELVQEPSRPLHQSTEPVEVARQVMSQLTRELLGQAQQQRAASVAALKDHDPADWSTGRDKESQTIDLWHRTMHVLVRMMEMGRGAETSRVLVQVIGEMMVEGRWNMFGASCSALAQVIRQGKLRSPEAMEGLRAALVHLCSGNRLLSLNNMLVSCTLPQFHQVAELLRILPREADPQLATLVSNAPPGEVQEQLVALLKERGVDLTDFLGQRLSSANLMHVLAAVEDLRKLGTPRAVTTLRKVLVHPSPRVRLEALRALTEYLDPSMGPQLVSALTQGHRDLRDLSLTLLERLQPDRQLVSHMVQLARQEDFEEWGPDHRTRLLKLLVRSGGKDCDEFIIKSVTALNPLRRKRVETLRMEMIRALGESGGRRSLQLLRACLEYRPSKSVRSAIELALRQAELSP